MMIATPSLLHIVYITDGVHTLAWRLGRMWFARCSWRQRSLGSLVQTDHVDNWSPSRTNPRALLSPWTQRSLGEAHNGTLSESRRHNAAPVQMLPPRHPSQCPSTADPIGLHKGPGAHASNISFSGTLKHKTNLLKPQNTNFDDYQVTCGGGI